MAGEQDCHICARGRDSTPETLIYRDDLWSAGSVADVPGWMMLWTNRHLEGGWSLSPEEASEFGPLFASVSTALRKVSDAECVYLMYLGETAKHFHALLIPRHADAPPEMRGPGIISKAEELADRPEALRIAEEVRAQVAL